MNEENWKKFIRKVKEDYYKIGSVPCPAFGGASIQFNEHGYRHLVIKYGTHRTQKDQKRRLRLVNKHAASIINSASTFMEYRSVTPTKSKNVSVMHFWSFKNTVGKKSITVIVRQFENLEKHFFSIMDKKIPDSAQTP